MVISGESPGSCPSEEARQAAIERINDDIKTIQVVIDCVNDYCGPGEWHRVAYIDMTNPQQICPPQWREYTSNNVRGCGRAGGHCSSTTFNTFLQYNKVCGRVNAYQLSSPDAFEPGGNTL